MITDYWLPITIIAMFDSHAHMHYDSYNEDRDQVIARSRAAGLSGWLEVAVDVATSQQAVALAQKEAGVYATVGVHPSDIGTLTPDGWETIESLVTQPQVVAVGEVGLDFYRGGTAQEQLPILHRFVALAVKHSLPVVFHVRDSADGNASAHDAMINFLESLPANERPQGVMHTFSGGEAQAERYLALGMYLSFSGVVTFKNAGPIATVATTMPLNRLLIETDCPFLTPEPHRGQRNEPAYVALVAEKIAALRKISVAEIERATDANAQVLFG